jgi:hypothetical protein
LRKITWNKTSISSAIFFLRSLIFLKKHAGPHHLKDKGLDLRIVSTISIYAYTTTVSGATFYFNESLYEYTYNKTTARPTERSKPIDNKQNTIEHQINTYTNWQRREVERQTLAGIEWK